MKDFFSQVAERRADAIAKLDRETFAPLIRNHLVQLFRKAHAKDKGLTGVLVGMGTAFVRGEYLTTFDEDDESQGMFAATARKWMPHDTRQPNHPETLALFQAVNDYSNRLQDFPDIDDITLDDLETTRAKKAAIHGPHGLRARMAHSPYTGEQRSVDSLPMGWKWGRKPK